jgi:hypothetical protein
MWRDNPLPLVFLYREDGGGGHEEHLHDDSSWAYKCLAEHLIVRLKAEGTSRMRLVRE